MRRLVKLVFCLDSYAPKTLPLLARSFGVSERTLRRDLDLLKEAGVPLLFDYVNENYSVAPEATPLHLSLDEAETRALTSVVQQLNQEPATFGEAIEVPVLVP